MNKYQNLIEIGGGHSHFVHDDPLLVDPPRTLHERNADIFQNNDFNSNHNILVFVGNRVPSQLPRNDIHKMINVRNIIGWILSGKPFNLIDVPIKNNKEYFPLEKDSDLLTSSTTETSSVLSIMADKKHSNVDCISGIPTLKETVFNSRLDDVSSTLSLMSTSKKNAALVEALKNQFFSTTHKIDPIMESEPVAIEASADAKALLVPSMTHSVKNVAIESSTKSNNIANYKNNRKVKEGENLSSKVIVDIKNNRKSLKRKFSEEEVKDDILLELDKGHNQGKDQNVQDSANQHVLEENLSLSYISVKEVSLKSTPYPSCNGDAQSSRNLSIEDSSGKLIYRNVGKTFKKVWPLSTQNSIIESNDESSSNVIKKGNPIELALYAPKNDDFDSALSNSFVTSSFSGITFSKNADYDNKNNHQNKNKKNDQVNIKAGDVPQFEMDSDDELMLTNDKKFDVSLAKGMSNRNRSKKSTRPTMK